MRRREFITLLGGALAAWPLTALAQQPGRVRRIGVLMPFAANDSVGQTRYAVFVQGLQQSGWTIGRNVQIEIRWATANAAAIRTHAVELVALGPDVIFVSGTQAAGLLLQATRAVPIVFVQVTDPVGAGRLPHARRTPPFRRSDSSALNRPTLLRIVCGNFFGV